jgi:hypothetical protein
MKRIITPCEQTLDFIRRFAREYEPGSEDRVGHFLLKQGKTYYFTDVFHIMER